MSFWILSQSLIVISTCSKKGTSTIEFGLIDWILMCNFGAFTALTGQPPIWSWRWAFLYSRTGLTVNDTWFIFVPIILCIFIWNAISFWLIIFWKFKPEMQIKNFVFEGQIAICTFESFCERYFLTKLRITFFRRQSWHYELTRSFF